jgi:hypothetical protein
MRRGALVCAVACATGGVTHANTSDMNSADYCELYERLWPQSPINQRLTMSQEIADAFTELGQSINQHVGELSEGRFALTFDGRRRRAFVRIDATTSDRYLVFHLASDVHFTQGVARVTAKLSFGVAGHVVDLELPDFEMAPAEYRGDRGVEIRLPILKRYF